MRITRRKFFKVLGLGVLAVPLARFSGTDEGSFNTLNTRFTSHWGPIKYRHIVNAPSVTVSGPLDSLEFVRCLDARFRDGTPCP